MCMCRPRLTKSKERGRDASPGTRTRARPRNAMQCPSGPKQAKGFKSNVVLIRQRS